MTGPLDLFQARRVAQGIARTDVTVKQAYGRSLAVRLGFDPGPAGADGGVDGCWSGTASAPSSSAG